MNFTEGLPIYVQIAGRLCDEILCGHYPPESRVPSTREYSALLGVNINTVVKSYDLLSQRGVLYNKRGLGCFVATDAPERIMAQRKADFLEKHLAETAREMTVLGISLDELNQHIKQYLHQHETL